MRKTAAHNLGRLVFWLVIAWCCAGISPRAMGGPPILEPFEPAPPHELGAVTDLLSDAGLDGLFLYNIDFEADGTVWIATADGLVRYDGFTWTRFGLNDGLPSDVVRYVFVASDGLLWIGTDHGIAQFDGATFRTVGSTDGPAGPNIRRIIEDPDGSMWFCSDQWIRTDVPGGLSRLKDGVWTVYRRDDGLPSDYVTDYFRDSQGRQFVLTGSGLAQLTDGQWTTPLIDAGFADADGYIWGIAETESGEIIVGDERRWYVLNDGFWSPLAREPTDPRQPKITTLDTGEIVCLHGAARSEVAFARWKENGFERVSPTFQHNGACEFIARGPDGAWWAVGFQLLTRWHPQGTEWRAWEDVGTPIGKDPSGNLWFTSNNDATCLTDSGWMRLPGAGPDLEFAPDGAVWSWSEDRVARHDERGTKEFSLADLDLKTILICRVRAADGRAIVSGVTQTGATVFLAIIDDEPTMISASSSRVVASAIDDFGGIWIVTQSAKFGAAELIRFKDSTTTAVRVPQIDNINRPRLLIGPDETAWLSGTFGLIQYDPTDESLTHYTDFPGRNATSVMHVGNVLWCVTNGISGGRRGVSYRRNLEWVHIERLSATRIAGSTETGPILGARGEIFRVDEESEFGFARLRLPVDGPVGRALQDSDSVLWIDAAGTTLSFQSDLVAPETIVPRLPQEIVQGDALLAQFDAQAAFRPRGDDHFSFSWRLDDGAWSPFGELDFEAISTQVEVGRHVLQIRARDQGLDIDPLPAAIAFTVIPKPIQARWWFWPTTALLFVSLGIVSILALISRTRVHEYADRLEDLVETRTSNLAASEARVRLLVENSPFGIILLDKSRRIESVNPAAIEILNAGDPATVIGTSLLKMLHAEDYNRVQSLIDRARLGEANSVLCTTRDGRICETNLVPVRFDHDDETQVMMMMIDVTDAKRLETRQNRLMRELDHRVKNNLAAIVGLAHLTASSSPDIQTFTRRFLSRVHALARTHELLAESRWRGTSVRGVVEGTMKAFVTEEFEQLVCDGPDVIAPPRVSGPLTMTLHELGVNAVKYGSLSVKTGTVTINWTVDSEGWIEFTWTELGGPVANEPTRCGSGASLISGFITHELRGELQYNFRAEGLFARFRFPLSLSNETPRTVLADVPPVTIASVAAQAR